MVKVTRQTTTTVTTVLAVEYTAADVAELIQADVAKAHGCSVDDVNVDFYVTGYQPEEFDSATATVKSVKEEAVETGGGE